MDPAHDPFGLGRVENAGKPVERSPKRDAGIHAHDGFKRGNGKRGLIAVDEERFVTAPVFLDSKTARPSGVLEVGPSPEIRAFALGLVIHQSMEAHAGDLDFATPAKSVRHFL